MNLSLYMAIVNAPWVFAQTADDTSVNPLAAWLPFVLVGAVLYFLAFRPQKKRAEALRNFQANLNVGDEVRTAGGILGVVRSISEDEVGVDVGGLTLRFARGAIAAGVSGDPEPADGAPEGDAE